MATLTIRKVDEGTHARLRDRARRHGRSTEAEVRAILDAEVNRPGTNILVALHQAVGAAGGVELDIPARKDRPRAVDL
ncbi:MAG: hypothetical protein LBG11_04315 [Bifidobacteriaceae bacterium]|nr:hypothetical protein [Bifidobacteriaceae bacterium]